MNIDPADYPTPPAKERGGLYKRCREMSDAQLADPAWWAEQQRLDQRHAAWLGVAAEPIPPAPFDEQFQERFVETLRLHPDFRGAVRAWLEATA